MIQINLFIKEKQTRRLREQTYNYQRGKAGGRDKMGVWDWHVEIQYVTLNVMWHAEYQSLSRVQYFATLWTVAHQAPLSMGFSRQEYRSGLPFPPPEDLPTPGIKPESLLLQVESLLPEPLGETPCTHTAAAAKSPQSCPTLSDPMDCSHQASPSMGFSRQEYWSGLPLPSPMLESQKWKWSCSVMSDSSQPHGLQPTSLLHPWDFPGKSTGVGCHCLLRYIYTCTQHYISHRYITFYYITLYTFQGIWGKWKWQDVYLSELNQLESHIGYVIN